MRLYPKDFDLFHSYYADELKFECSGEGWPHGR